MIIKAGLTVFSLCMLFAEPFDAIGASPSNWTVVAGSSRMDDSPTVHVWTQAAKPIDISNTTIFPLLVIRCHEGRTNLLIDFDRGLVADFKDYGLVTFRVDKSDPFSLNLAATTDNHALALGGSSNAISFIEDLFGAETLLVRVRPFMEPRSILEFDVAGLEEAITPLREACHW